jgi:hypothetical protein
MSGFKRIIIDNHYKKNLKQRKIIFRSLWELAFANFLDNNNNVKSWENDFKIKYLDKFNSPPKIRIYLVDFKIIMNDDSTLLVEVKPLRSLQERVETKSFRYKLIHTTNYLKNLSKFETVELFCRKIGWKFYLAEKQEHHFKFFRWDITNKKPVPI